MNLDLTIDPALQISLRIALALLFCWAASHKLLDLNHFRRSLAAYELLPVSWVGGAALGLAATESAIAALLVVPRTGGVAALVAAGLLFVYAAAISVNLQRGRGIDCGCTGAAGRQPIGSSLVARNLVLVVAALGSALPVGARSLRWVDAFTIVACVVTLVVLYAAVDGLMALPRRGVRARPADANHLRDTLSLE